MFRLFGRFCGVAFLVSSAACSPQQAASVGLSTSNANTVSTVTTDLAAGGQLFCQAEGVLYQAGYVKVTNATASTVAKACSALQVGTAIVQAVPVPAIAGQTAVVATVSPANAAAVAASVPAS